MASTPALGRQAVAPPQSLSRAASSRRMARAARRAPVAVASPPTRGTGAASGGGATPSSAEAKFALPVVSTPDAHVARDAEGYYRLKEEHTKGINPFEKLKLAKEPHKMMIVDKEYEVMAKTGMKAWDEQGKEAENDIDQRLKWIGFFHRRKVTYGRFMMRLKLSNGIATADQVRALADIVARYGDDGCADVTTRQNFQLRGITLEDVPWVMDKLASANLTSVQSGLDNVRNTVGNPLAGIDPHELIDTRPLCAAIDRYVLNEGEGNKDITNLPRKWNVCVVGSPEMYEHPHINDLAFVPAVREGVMGFNLLVGGYFSATRCAEAIPMDAWVPVDGMVPATHAILTAFRDFGSRANRQKCRMMWLVEEMGVEGWRAEVARRMPGGLLARAAEKDLIDPAWPRRSYYGVHKQKQPGLNYVGLSVPVGRLEAEDMVALAALTETYGDGDLRLTVEQNVILSGVPDAKLEALLKEPLLQRFSPAPGRVMSGLVACTGNQFCGFSNIDTKRQSWSVAEHLESVFEFPRDIRMHWTGCPNTCGQIQVGDIGLLGTQVKAPDGKPGKVPAVDILVGGTIGAESHLAETWREGVRCEGELLPALEQLCVERFGAVRKATPSTNPMRFKSLKAKSHENKPAAASAGAPAKVATHVCLDCGYLYTLPTPFDAQPEDFACPQCGAAKSRFKPAEAEAPAAKRRPAEAVPAPADGAAVALRAGAPVALALMAKDSLSHDTRRFRFALPAKTDALGLPVGQHVLLSYTDAATGETVSRPYTPTSDEAARGHVDLVIKVYRANENPRFPAGGKMSQHLESMQIGDKIQFEGPSGRITYRGGGVFAVRDVVSGEVAVRPAVKAVGMVAGGTGITPMLQVIRAMLARKEDIDIHLLYANKSEADILLRPELERMQMEHPNFKLWYTLDTPPTGWRQGAGFVTADMLKARMPAAAPNVQILMCGPPGMTGGAATALKGMGFGDDQLLTF